MRHLHCMIFLTAFLFSKTFGQTETYKKLLDTAVSPSNSLFVSSKPIGIIKLNTNKMWEYYNNYIDDSRLALDTVMFAQIIQNSKHADTTLWSDAELDRIILIKKRTDPVDINYVISKFSLQGNRQIKPYKKIINDFNSVPPADRRIYSYSRPVFDNSKQFAIVQWNNEHNGISSEGGIILYQSTEDGWAELGNVLTWKY